MVRLNFLGKLYSKINTPVREYLRKKELLSKVEMFQLMGGFFGMAYSVIFSLYFAIKINLNSAWFFVVSFMIGLWIVYSTKKGIMNESTEKRERETYIL